MENEEVSAMIDFLIGFMAIIMGSYLFMGFLDQPHALLLASSITLVAVGVIRIAHGS